MVFVGFKDVLRAFRGCPEAVLAAQDAEIKALKAQLLDVQRESQRLKSSWRDATSELHVASEATGSATERLNQHAARQELLLSAGVERSGVEQVQLEEELQCGGQT